MKKTSVLNINLDRYLSVFIIKYKKLKSHKNTTSDVAVCMIPKKSQIYIKVLSCKSYLSKLSMIKHRFSHR